LSARGFEVFWDGTSTGTFFAILPSRDEMNSKVYFEGNTTGA
jgi:hypothetical protein